MGLPETRLDVKNFIEADNFSVNPSPCDDVITHVFDNVKPVIEITVGAESVNTIPVTIQVTRSNGDPLKGLKVLRIWLSDTSNGVESGTAPDGPESVNTGTTLVEHTTGIHWDIITDVNGTIQIDIVQSGTQTFYLNVLNGNEIVTSDALEFTT